MSDDDQMLHEMHRTHKWLALLLSLAFLDFLYLAITFLERIF